MNIVFPKLELENIINFDMNDISKKFNLVSEMKRLNICDYSQIETLQQLEDTLEEMRVYFNENNMYTRRNFYQGSAFLIRGLIYALTSEEKDLYDVAERFDNYYFQLRDSKKDALNRIALIAEQKKIKEKLLKERV